MEWLPDGTRLLSITEQQPRRVLVIDVATGRYEEFLRREGYSLYGPALSPDARWLAQVVRSGSAEFQLFVLPLAEWRPPAGAEWTPVAGARTSGVVRWSPDGNTLYFLSDSDGYFCVWAQRFDRSAGRPQGPPFAVQHFHSARRSLSSLTAPFLRLSRSEERRVGKECRL